MTATRWRAVGIVAAVLLLVVAWFAVVSPAFGHAAELRTEAASQESASQQLQSRISLLKKQSEELPAQEAKLAAVQQRMPKTAALPTLIRNLTSVAQEAHVTVGSVTPGRPTPIQQPAPPPPPPAADSASTSGSDTTDAGADSDAADASAAPAGAAGMESQPSGPAAETMTMNITVCGSFAELRNYLRGLESMRRVTMVSGLTITRGSCAEGSAESDLTANLTAHVFTLPQSDPGTSATKPSGEQQ